MNIHGKESLYMWKRTVTAISVLFLTISGARGASLAPGDVIASVSGGQFNHYSNTGVLKGVMSTGAAGFTTGGAYRNGVFYGTHFSNGRVYRFNQSGAAPLGSFVTGGVSPESIAFNAAGDMYIGHADGDWRVRKFNQAGTPLATSSVARESRGSDWIDLAADQKTLYYTSEGFRILRYDLSTGTQLSDFAVLSDRPAFALRILGDGGVLVANSVNIKRLNSSGTVVQTYDFAGTDSWFALNLDPDGQTFWSGDINTGRVSRFNIATGAVVTSFITVPGNSLFGVTVVGEQTAAVPVVPLPPAAFAGVVLLGVISVPNLRRRLGRCAR